MNFLNSKQGLPSSSLPLGTQVWVFLRAMENVLYLKTL